MTKTYRLVLWWMLVIAILSSIPGITLPKFDLFSADKLAHAFVYFVLAVLILRCHFRQNGNLAASKIGWFAFLFSSAYGILIEIMQGTLIPGRFCELDDAIANAFGATCGVLFFHLAKTFNFLKKIILSLLVLTICPTACTPPEDESFALPTKICVRTQHHHQPIPDATVFIKFNADSFPGYDAPPSFFDKSFRTGKNASGCLEAVPEGRHWLVAFGYDSLYFPHDVFGSLQVEVSLSGRATVDTILYISE